MNAISISTDIKSHLDNGTFIPPQATDLLTLHQKTKFVTNTTIDIMKAVKNLILVDTGANGSFTPHLNWIHNIKYFTKPQLAMVGDGFKCQVLALGYWLLPTSDGRVKPFPVKYAPSLPSVFSCEHVVSRLKLLTGYSIHQKPDKHCVEFSTRTIEGAFDFETITLDKLPYLKDTPVPIPRINHILTGDKQTFALHDDDEDMNVDNVKEFSPIWTPTSQMEITPQQGLISRYFVTNNISEVVQKNVHFDDKIQVFSDSDSNELENMQWMTDDWNKQTLQTTSQHIAFIDDDGDTHFFDAQDGQDNFL